MIIYSASGFTACSFYRRVYYTHIISQINQSEYKYIFCHLKCGHGTTQKIILIITVRRYWGGGVVCWVGGPVESLGWAIYMRQFIFKVVLSMCCVYLYDRPLQKKKKPIN